MLIMIIWKIVMNEVDEDHLGETPGPPYQMPVLSKLQIFMRNWKNSKELPQTNSSKEEKNPANRKNEKKHYFPWFWEQIEDLVATSIKNS